MSQKQDMVLHNLSSLTVRRLEKLKDDQGFGEKDFGEWLTHMAADVKLKDSPAEAIQRHTKDGMLKTWVQNLGENLPKIKSGPPLSDLVPEESRRLEAEGKDPGVPVPGKSAIVIGKGPTIFKFKHLETLAKSDYSGSIVCSDGALRHVLDAGVKPSDYEKFIVMSVDGNRDLIWKLYDHPLLDEYAKDIKVLLCSTCSPTVVTRLEKAGIHPYFFHPIFDDWTNIESYTKIEQYITTCEKHPNGVPALSAGGNSGSACWVFSWVVLRRNPVALLGIDFSYLLEDDLTKTYYWDALMKEAKGNSVLVRTQYSRIYNPDWGSEAVMDAVMDHYRGSFLDMLQMAPKWLKTVNTTEGGALFGNGLVPMKFKEFLEKNKS